MINAEFKLIVSFYRQFFYRLLDNVLKYLVSSFFGKIIKII